MPNEVFSDLILPEIRFPGDPASYIAPTYDHLDEICFRLAGLVKGVEMQDGKPYDRVIVLASGAWTMARAFIDYLGTKNATSIRFSSYEGMKKLDKPKLIESLPPEVSVEGAKIISFDDVNDSGETDHENEVYLLSKGAIVVDSAVLYQKSNVTKHPSRFHGPTTSSWIVFPHERTEFLQERCLEWLQKGVDPKDVEERLARLSIPVHRIEKLVAGLIKERGLAR